MLIQDMSYREWLAGLAMQGLLASDANLDHQSAQIAVWAVRQAEDVIDELEKTNGNN